MCHMVRSGRMRMAQKVYEKVFVSLVSNSDKADQIGSKRKKKDA